MLARLARELPRGPYLYEPKWDGFRALAFRDGREIELQSRHGRPLARYFPELVEGLAAVRQNAFVLDGEIVVSRDGGFDFPALMARLHPAASRVERLRTEAPALFVAFDLLALGAEDLTREPFERRRARLEELLTTAEPTREPGRPGASNTLLQRTARGPRSGVSASREAQVTDRYLGADGTGAARIRATPITDDPDVAGTWLASFAGGGVDGVDGVVAKRRDLRYEPGRREMVKVKTERTAECVVGGFRWHVASERVGSLVLGLYDDDGSLRHVGVSTSFTREGREQLAAKLAPLVAGIEGHPWEHGFGLGRSPLGRLLGSAGRWDPREMALDWVPVRPELVCEVAYDQLDENRFRHPARFLRWRTDRDARSCLLEQLETARDDVPTVRAG